MPKERTLTDRVAGQDKAVRVRVEPSEGIVANDPIKRCLTPTFKRDEQQLSIGHRAGPAAFEVQRADELIAIVESDIRHEREATILRDQRLAVIPVLRKQSEEPAAQGHPAKLRCGGI